MIYGSKPTIECICELTQKKQLGHAWTLLWIEFKTASKVIRGYLHISSDSQASSLLCGCM